MFKSACDTMKKLVVLSASLMLTGIFLEIIAQLATYETVLPVYFAYAGVFAIGLGLIVLISVFLAMMIPAVNHRLDTCQH